MIDIASTIVFFTLSESGQEKVTMLWEKYHKRIKSTVFRLLKDESAADEIVGDAFVKFMMHYDAYEDFEEEKMKAILIKTAKRLAYNKNESNIIRKTDPITLYDDDGDEYERVLVSDDDIEDLMICRENVERIKNALIGIKPEYSEVIRLRAYAELDYREISNILDITEATARKRFERGVKLIKKEFEDDE